MLLIVAAAFIVAIVASTLIDQIVKSFGPADQRSAESWEAAVSPIIEESNSLGALLRATPSALSTEDRAGLDATMTALRSGTDEQEEIVASLRLAPPSSQAAALLRAVLGERMEAAQSFADGVGLATGPSHDVSGAATRFAALDSAVRRSDTAYRELVRLLRGDKGSLPTSDWLSDPSPFAPVAAGRLAGELAMMPRLAEIRRLSIVAISLAPTPDRIVGLPNVTTTTAVPNSSLRTTTSPTTTLSPGAGGTSATSTSAVTTTTAPVVTTTTLQLPPAGSRSYLLPTASIKVTVVAKNSGDVALNGVRIAATLVPSPSSVAAKTLRQTVAVGTLDAGGSSSVVLGPIAVTSRVPTYELEVSVTANDVASANHDVELVTSAGR